MSGKQMCAPTEIFPAVRFKAIDYVFESSTSLKVMMDLLALPTPYLIGTGYQYPHSGELQHATYRTPWVRETVIPSCKLFVGGSLSEDLGGCKQPLHAPERFSRTDGWEVVPSSNPESLVDSDQDDDPLRESLSDSCHESFFRWEPEDDSNDLLLPEELVTADHLPQLSHLPTLKAKLSRLKILPVADPLLGSAGDPVSEDTVFSCLRHCASFDVDSADAECARLHEEFLKEPLLQEESLLLPAVVETVQLTADHCSAFSAVRAHVDVSPEVLNEQRSVLDVLCQASLSNAPVDVSQYDGPEEAAEGCTMSGHLKDSHLAEHLVLPTETELDVPLSPTPKKSLTHTRLSTSELQEEQLDPFYPMSLMSARAHKEMKMELWKAEKHHMFVMRFLLSEAQMDEAADDFQPLCEALTTFHLEKQSLCEAGDNLQPRWETGVPLEDLCGRREIAKSLSSDVEERREEFRKLPMEDMEDQTPLQEDASHSSFPVDTVSADNQAVPPAATIGADVSGEKLSGAAGQTSAPADSASRKEDERETERSECRSEQVVNSHPKIKAELNMRGINRGPLLARRPYHRGPDLLSTFMALRTQQVASVTAAPQSLASIPVEVAHQMPQPQPPPEDPHSADKKLGYTSAAVSGNATREPKPAAQRMDKPPGCPPSQSDRQEGQDSIVVQVQATESQQRAYAELLALAVPCLHSARELGLSFPVWGDFSCLGPDQTHFLLKQQERALHRTPGQSADLLRDQELLFNQAALIHILVTLKELLLKCNLTTALEYLTKAVEARAEPSLEQLLKRLQVILYLSLRNLEPNFKLLQLQQLLAEWLHSNKGQISTGKVLVVISADGDDSRSIINSLKQVTGAVIAIGPEADMKKLHGVTVVSSVCSSVCAVVHEQHIGPDFPWSCFCLLVEYDHPGHSPWASVCRGRSIGHLTFNTCVADTEKQQNCWNLQDNLPFVLFVTEGLLNCPLLLQTLESNFSITVLERSHCPTLQMLGGIQNYAVITVDESTAIFIQQQDELLQEKAGDGLVMRLSALSLQYSCCWLVLLCPHSQGGRFCGEAFNNLVLLYSSLVLFSMKTEDLDVKVLIVSDVLETARWISQICFHSLMCSDRDPHSYLARDWLTVVPSQDEACLSKFPCVNPLVGQLMLSRAPSLQWLLRAPLSQLKEQLPEVPHKVLKLFSDITSLYSLPAEASQPQTIDTDASQHTSHQSVSSPPELLSDSHSTPFPFGGASAQGSFFEQRPGCAVQEDDSGFRFDLNSSFGSPIESFQRSWTSSDPWRNQEGEEGLPGWGSEDGAAGRAAERPNNQHFEHFFFRQDPESPFKLESTFSYSPVLQMPASTQLSPFGSPYSVLHRSPSASGLNLPNNAPWGGGPSSLCGSGGALAASANYSSRCWMGQERKRSGEEAGEFGSALTPLKKGRLSYEKVPGRIDGQTRLRLL